ncbi:hypothetical protein [Roseomonas populi]|uniref:Alpha/beta hydrolase n=1 Tax=Roseomonas populi TaxID=3121582 RepID=A0ABT1WY65_9PROT|nr:hypothetical protein [Roseomonas pecuniae]MCR0980780.1 hypothetical protein [Roseomonas pecuniae]
MRGIAGVGRVLPPVLSRVLGPARVAGWLRTLSARGTGVTFLYSDRDSGLEEMDAHFGEGGRHLAGMPGMRVELIPDADHILSTRPMRRDLVGRVEDILQKTAPRA